MTGLTHQVLTGCCPNPFLPALKCFNDRSKEFPFRQGPVETFTADKNAVRLQENNTILAALCDHIVRPDTGLDLTDMSLSKVQHTEPGLPDATSNRQG